MDHGKLKQLGTPEQVYSDPADLFVAGFVGDVNSLAGTVATVDGSGAVLELDGGAQLVAPDAGMRSGERVVCIVRPERIAVWAPGALAPEGVRAIGEAHVADSVFMGPVRQLDLEWQGVEITVRMPAADAPPDGADRVCFGWRLEDAAVFAAG
jgi:ABC-type Fe3+/spermidine/putrescine transport system ATPase subunit